MAASQLLGSQRQVQERVRVYNHDLQEDLLAGTSSLRDKTGRSTTAPAGSRKSWLDGDEEGMGDTLRERMRAQRAIREAEMAQQQAQFKATLQRRKEAESARSDAALSALLGDVISGIQSPDGIAMQTDAAISHAAKVRHNKKEALHREWSDKVFDTIQGRLQASVNARDPTAIEWRLKSQYDQFLNTCNTRVGVFRDEVDPEYNPLTARDDCIRVPTGDIRDPLKRDVLKGEYERRLMSVGSGAGSPGTSANGRSPSGSPGPGSGPQHSRETLDTKQWGALAIGATPYGHCVDATGGYVVRPLSHREAQLRSSRVPMDHYTFPTTNEAAAAEVPPGKRVVPGPERRRGRQDLFDVVHHTCHSRPKEYTGGDAWLEARGKAYPPGPEVRRGRRDLGDVLQQKAVHEGLPADPRVAGDAWLEARGKAQVQGPEVRRGRAGLYETLHCTSNPYEGGSCVGDAWLEYKGRRVPPHVTPEAAATLAAVPLPPVARPPPDERKYGTHLGPVGGQLTVKE